VPFAIDAVAALVPGRGAAATQAEFNLDNRDQVFSLLQAGRSAEQIIATVTAPDNDRRAAARQYGVVTLDEVGVMAMGYTGDRNMDWAGDRQDQAAAVSVQGNLLAGEAVVTEALAAFTAVDIGPVSLSDRLLRALEAGSAQGGDRRCNREAVQQTATAAFIMVAQAGQPPYATSNIRESEVGQAGTPWLYLSVTEPAGGANPLLELRHQYDTWRAGHLPACSDCNLASLLTSPGQTAPPAEETSKFSRLWLAAGLVVLLLAVLLLFWGLRRQKA
jgi:uncharacterized Ntn-hydrolase superfamily protein